MNRRIRLRRSKDLDRSKGTLGRGKGLRKRTRDRGKRARVFERNFHSAEYVAFVRALPCVKCGRAPCDVSHDPSRGAGGGWQDTHPLCRACHLELGRGSETFWSGLGRTREEANAETQRKWEEHCERVRTDGRGLVF